MNRSDLAWFLHVGDILWYPCSDVEYRARLRALNAIRHPVVYTPGDNEWTDCHEPIAGEYEPLDRLRSLRAIFFPEPGRTFGGSPMEVESQAADSAFAEFVENVRWTRGGFVFATLHLVGSGNATEPFAGRTEAHDQAVARRTEAAEAWMEQAFDVAERDAAKGIVLALHASMWDGGRPQPYPEFRGFVRRLAERVAAFPGEVLLVHGDDHTYIVDHPLEDPESGRPLDNFARIETFGSSDIGWVRVVLDSVAGRVVGTEPRLMPGWWLW
ncbi:MAG TPA: hypothetical protein VGA70_06215 [Longimicrobiales bacterium]